MTSAPAHVLRLWVAALSAMVLAAACAPAVPSFPLRAEGDRTPLTAPCDDMDATRCLLPWPSNTFTTADVTTETGLRLAVSRSSLSINDDPAPLNRADGFSTVTPVATAFSPALDIASLAPRGEPQLRLVMAQRGSPLFGSSVPLRLRAVASSLEGQAETLLVGLPRQALVPGSDYVAVVLDGLRTTNGTAIPASASTQAALGRASPANEREARLFAYHSPTRAALAAAGIAANRVVRVWSFTTRTTHDPTQRFDTMRTDSRAAVDAASAGVVVESVAAGQGSIAVVIKGHLTGLPNWLSADGMPSFDATGRPLRLGQRDAPFRVVVPTGTGNYPVLLYGHGNSGSVDDPMLDTELAGAGIAKVSIQYEGWSGTGSLTTLLGLRAMYTGTERASSYLLQSLANEAAVERSLTTILGDALSAATVGGMPNPAAGRRPDASRTFVGGGSLGAAMGLVYATATDSVSAAVLNVVGAGWTHNLLGGRTFTSLAPLLRPSYPSDLDLTLSMLQTQGVWDVVDGAVWAPLRVTAAPVLLLQESIDDPVVPNVATELAAAVVRAAQIRPAIVPVDGLDQVDVADGRSALTQFRVVDADPLAVHGFAARRTPAAQAARDQMVAFLGSVLAGAPRIAVPTGCVVATPLHDCNFGPP
ncbi:MAG: hypothetical protein EPO40_29060 [Myxococcaceae bacterium]|nr:MAG: hypothetical protein EPO40_29060 [Myxococcaceae bacterium]